MMKLSAQVWIIWIVLILSVGYCTYFLIWQVPLIAEEKSSYSNEERNWVAIRSLDFASKTRSHWWLWGLAATIAVVKTKGRVKKIVFLVYLIPLLYVPITLSLL